MRDKKSLILYVLSFLAVLGIKLCFDKAGSDELLWILRPTAWWTTAVSGIPFTYEQGVGYVNHSLRFIIAPACAGLRFWMIAGLMLAWSFVHRIDNRKKQLYWVTLSFPATYLATVFVNGIRITLSIILPTLLCGMGDIMQNLSSSQLHTAIGVLVYFPSLLAIYQAGDKLSQKIGKTKELPKKQPLYKVILPTLWYLIPVLILPLLSRIAYRDYKNLTAYELPVITVCGTILLLLTLYKTWAAPED